MLEKILAEAQTRRFFGLATDGKEAISKLVEEKPRVVVMDIWMPVMDGIEKMTFILF